MPVDADAGAGIALKCKRICVLRCLYAICWNVILQYVLLAVFLLFINFNIFHPIQWILNTSSSLLSFYTFIRIIPLITGISFYGIVMGKMYLAETIYYPTKFMELYKTCIKQLLFYTSHTFFGFITVWFYIKFLHTDYNYLLYRCGENGTNTCINEKYMFLITNGLFTGFYLLLIDNHKTERNTLLFPIIQQNKYLEMRSQLYDALKNSLFQSIFPTFIFVIGYALLGNLYHFKFAKFIGCHFIEQTTYIYDIKLILSNWIITSIIISNMHLILDLFSIFLTEYKKFPIECITATTNGVETHSEISLIDALQVTSVPIIKELACLDLYTIATKYNDVRRKDIFALSIPGGHPYNWNALNEQILKLINVYKVELSQSMEHLIIPIDNNFSSRNDTGIKVSHLQLPQPTTATELAEKLRFRQFNESFGIRNLSVQQNVSYINASSSSFDLQHRQQHQQKHQNQQYDPCKRFDNSLDLIKEKYIAFKIAVLHTPGISYLFNESKLNKVAFVLSKSQHIIWLTQGLATLVVHSINEDKYGVVQNDLNNIIKTLLELKKVLDKINTINLDGRKLPRNCIALKNAVRNSLYKIATVFSDYLTDLNLDVNDLYSIQNFVNYKEP